MALTGQLGTANSLPGHMLLGANGVPPSLVGTASGGASLVGKLQRPDKTDSGTASSGASMVGLLSKPARAISGTASGGASALGMLTGGSADVTAIVELDGWGDEEWGEEAWGGGGEIIAGFAFVNAVAVAENIVRVEFTENVYFSMYLDAQDASNPKRFLVTAVPGTVGYDGDPARAVRVVAVQLSPVTEGFGRFLDVYVDRPMSPYPAQYKIDVSNVLVSANTKESFDPSSLLSVTLFGLYRQLVAPTLDSSLPSRDIANPSSRVRQQDGGFAANDNDYLLGTFHVDETGDYASDSGLANLKKRIYRRLTTRKGAFAHLPDYGVGIVEESKRLSTPTTRDRLVAECERQIMQEPDVDRVRITIVIDPARPALVRFIILVKTKAGQKDKFEIPLRRAA